MRYVENYLNSFPFMFTPRGVDDELMFDIADEDADSRLKICLEIQRPDDDEPIDFELEDYMLRPEVSRWLETMAKEEWEFEGYDGSIAFRSKADAMAFRLAWLT